MAFPSGSMTHVGGEDRSRLAEAERRQRILSDVSRVLLDYVGPDEIEPLRRIVHQVTEAMANDLCAFTLLPASTGKGRRYSKDDLDFAYSLAGRAALAVRNARLVAELARQRDIQSQERSEADRRFAELRAVFDSNPNGIALFDARGLLRMASLRIEEIFGIPLRAMYGQRFDEIYRQKLAQVVSHDREAMLDRKSTRLNSSH